MSDTARDGQHSHIHTFHVVRIPNLSTATIDRGLTDSLAISGIPTYLLVPIAQKSKTVEALRGDGWIFVPATEPSID
jgi:hypothetical protein